jgi:Leucine Rich repeat
MDHETRTGVADANSQDHDQMIDQGERPSSTKRRFRVTLGFLMVVIVVLCVWLARTTNRARRQGEAVARITRLGGKVGYNHNFDPKLDGYPSRPDEAPPLPRWLLDRIGPDCFRQANAVWVCGDSPEIREVPDLEFLDNLPDVRFLNLMGTRVADSEFSHVHSLNLVHFYASGSRLGDEGLARIGAMDELEDIELYDTRVTDVGLAHLARMSRLQYVNLARLKVTDAGLVALARLTRLKVLNLSHTSVTDAGLAHLKGLEQLSNLGLAETSVTDAGLAHLRGLEQLSTLDLTGTKLTDAALVHIKAIPNLKLVILPKSGVTDEGIADLKQARPQLTINRAFY